MSLGLGNIHQHSDIGIILIKFTISQMNQTIIFAHLIRILLSLYSMKVFVDTKLLKKVDTL